MSADQDRTGWNHGHGDRSPAVDGTALYNALSGPLELPCPDCDGDCAEWWDCPRDREMMQQETGDWERARLEELMRRVDDEEAV